MHRLLPSLPLLHTPIILFVFLAPSWVLFCGTTYDKYCRMGILFLGSCKGPESLSLKKLWVKGTRFLQ